MIKNIFAYIFIVILFIQLIILGLNCGKQNELEARLNFLEQDNITFDDYLNVSIDENLNGKDNFLFDVIDNYEIEISDSLQKRLNIQKSTDVCLYSLITLSSNVNNITANLKAPLVINIKSMEGEQFITECDEYKIKHPIKKG